MADMHISSNDFARLKKKMDKPDKNVSREFQIYGYELAQKLNDMTHKSLYIKLAKEKPRGLLERALQFVLDYPNAKSKGRLFMYKLKELETQKK